MTAKETRIHHAQAVIGLTPEQAAEGAICIRALADLFKPSVEAVVFQHVERMFEEPVTREEIDAELAFIWTEGLRSWQELPARLYATAHLALQRLWVGKKGKRLRYSSRQRRRILDDASTHCAYGIVRAWLDILCMECKDQGGVLPLWRLDDAMVPQDLDPRAFLWSVPVAISGADVLIVLRDIRNNLPDGRELPEHAERFLHAEGYEIRP